MKPQLILKIAFILVVVQLTTAAASNIKYSRKDCIVKTKLLWPLQTSEEVKESLIQKFVKSNNDLLRKIGNPAFSVPSYNRNYIYFQFSNSCEKKFEMVTALMLKVKARLPDFPKVNVCKEIVLPSIDTIMVTGDAWKD